MGHRATYGLRFFNALDEDVKLIPENDVDNCYTPDSFKPIQEQVIHPRDRFCVSEELTDYEESRTVEETQLMQRINVVVGSDIAGHISILRGIVPDPVVSFRTNSDSNFKLRIRRSRFGGPRVLEIVPKTW